MNFPHHNLMTRITFASASPAQTRRPAEKGRKFTELVTTWPSPSIWRCGLNLVGSSQQLGSMWTAIRLGTTTVSFGTRYPASVVSFRVLWGRAVSATFPRRSVSMIVAWTSGRLGRSSRPGIRSLPTSSSNWFWISVWQPGLWTK